MDICNLEGKKGLIVGIANDQSIAWGAAKICHAAGAELAVTYLNEKAEKYVRPLAEEAEAALILPLDVTRPEQMEAVFEAIKEKWGRLDFLLHSIAYAPKEDLQARVTDCSLEGFKTAMDISCHSFIRMVHRAEPLMAKGGSLLTMTYLGSEEVVPNYNLMGPVKAALESATRYMAAELGDKNIRVNAISPGPVKTRAASGVEHFEEILESAKKKAPLHHLINTEDVGKLVAFLASDASVNITGNVHYIDAGYAIID